MLPRSLAAERLDANDRIKMRTGVRQAATQYAREPDLLATEWPDGGNSPRGVRGADRCGAGVGFAPKKLQAALI
jgi:hypothetical protein